MTPGKRSRGPTSIGSVLGASAGLARSAGQVDRTTWCDVVGQRVAARTQPGALRDGELIVRVASSVWAQELSLLSTTILGRLRQAGVTVKRLRFHVGTVDPLPPGFVRTAPPPVRAKLPDDLLRRLDQIEDPELRAAVAEAAAYGMGRQQSRGDAVDETDSDLWRIT